jgi:hypothetical protein
MTFRTSSTRMENVAREEGYEAGFEDGFNQKKNPYISLSEAEKLVGDYGLAVDSMDSERMRLACKALFDALLGRE